MCFLSCAVGMAGESAPPHLLFCLSRIEHFAVRQDMSDSSFISSTFTISISRLADKPLPTPVSFFVAMVSGDTS